MQTPTQQLQNIRLVMKGDIDKWLEKVKRLVDAGADVRVLDNYKGEGSIISKYIAYGDIQSYVKRKIASELFAIGVAPTPRIFVDCLMIHDGFSVADVVLDAAARLNRPINMNDLDFYGIPVHEWVARSVIKKRLLRKTTVDYLISKGLRTNAKIFSIDDIISMADKHGEF